MYFFYFQKISKGCRIDVLKEIIKEMIWALNSPARRVELTLQQYNFREYEFFLFFYKGQSKINRHTSLKKKRTNHLKSIHIKVRKQRRKGESKQVRNVNNSFNNCKYDTMLYIFKMTITATYNIFNAISRYLSFFIFQFQTK